MMRWTVAVAAALVLYDSRVQAHHSIFSIYDQNREATLEGTVAEFLLVNPHPFLFIDVDEAGATKRWRLEMDNAASWPGSVSPRRPSSAATASSSAAAWRATKRR